MSSVLQLCCHGSSLQVSSNSRSFWPRSSCPPQCACAPTLLCFLSRLGLTSPWPSPRRDPRLAQLCKAGMVDQGTCPAQPVSVAPSSEPGGSSTPGQKRQPGKWSHGSPVEQRNEKIKHILSYFRREKQGFAPCLIFFLFPEQSLNFSHAQPPIWIQSLFRFAFAVRTLQSCFVFSGTQCSSPRANWDALGFGAS